MIKKIILITILLLAVAVYGADSNKNLDTPRFIENQPPVIDPDDIFTMPYNCGWTSFSTEIEIFDNEGDALDVTVNYGAITLINIDGGPGIPTTYTYAIDIDANVLCGECHTFDFAVTAFDGFNSPPTEFIYDETITFVGKIIASMDSALYMWPGTSDYLPVYLDPCGSCFCLGSFSLAIMFDISVTPLTDVIPGEAIQDGEYFNVIYDAYGTGTVRVDFINDLDDQNPAEVICDINPEQPLLYLEVYLSPEFQYPDNFTIPIDFIDNEPNDSLNNVVDKDTSCVWFSDACDDVVEETMKLELINGNIKVLTEDPIIGDINLNGYPFEIGDFTLAYNAVMDIHAYPLTIRQRYAGDIDQDDNPLTITDLLYLYYYATGMEIPDYSYNPEADTFIIESADANPGDTLLLPVFLITSDTLVGFQAYMVADREYITLDTLILNDSVASMQTFCTGNPHVLAQVFWEPFLMNPGTYHIGDLIAYINPDITGPVTTNIEFRSYPDSLSYTGLSCITFFEPVLINAEITISPAGISPDDEIILPVKTSINAYPNPFNSSLKIYITAPAPSDLTIYDILGRTVRTFKVDSGSNSLTWDATDNYNNAICAGVYFIKLNDSKTNLFKKVVYLR